LRFTGGRHDGAEIYAPDLPLRFKFPEPVPLERLMDRVDPLDTRQRVSVYQLTAERLIDADTGRLVGGVYEFCGH
jgi:hypothetical protein